MEGRNGWGFVDLSGGLVSESFLRFLNQAMVMEGIFKDSLLVLESVWLENRKGKTREGKRRRKSGCCCSHYLTNGLGIEGCFRLAYPSPTW